MKIESIKTESTKINTFDIRNDKAFWLTCLPSLLSIRLSHLFSIIPASSCYHLYMWAAVASRVAHYLPSREVWLQVFSYLYTKDLVVLSHRCKHLHDIAEDVRKQRQDFNRLLANFLKDIDRFRLLMKHTGTSFLQERHSQTYTTTL